MYNIEELKLRLLSELKEIAETLGVSNFKKLNKQDLIYAILDQQAITPDEKLPRKLIKKRQKSLLQKQLKKTLLKKNLETKIASVSHATKIETITEMIIVEIEAIADLSVKTSLKLKRPLLKLL